MEQELASIRQARQGVYRFKPKEILILILGIAISIMLPPLAIILWIVVVYYVFLRIKRVAYLPCPRCGQPFGSTAKIPLGVGGPACQNCDLHLYLGEKGKDDNWNAS
jgi:hypothetical protein